MSFGRARLDGDCLYGEPLFSLLGEVAAGFRGRDMVWNEFVKVPIENAHCPCMDARPCVL